MTPDELERFNAKWAEDPDTGCHLWTACVTNGQPRFMVGGRNRPAHRALWAHHFGEPPRRLSVHRTCSSLCVRLDHLSLGTPTRCHAATRHRWVEQVREAAKSPTPRAREARRRNARIATAARLAKRRRAS